MDSYLLAIMVISSVTNIATLIVLAIMQVNNRTQDRELFEEVLHALEMAGLFKEVEVTLPPEITLASPGEHQGEQGDDDESSEF